MRQWRASLARSKPNSSTTANTQIAMARGATCSLISKAITIVRGSTPQSATSPHNRQRQKLHDPVSTFPGEGQVLGLWIEQTEGAKFWLKVMNELKNRGLNDILIAVVDGLKGFPEAIATVFPLTTVQTCI